MASGDDRRSALLINSLGEEALMPAKVTQPSPCPGIKGGHTGGGESTQVPGHLGEAMLQGRGGD